MGEDLSEKLNAFFKSGKKCILVSGGTDNQLERTAGEVMQMTGGDYFVYVGYSRTDYSRADPFVINAGDLFC